MNDSTKVLLPCDAYEHSRLKGTFTKSWSNHFWVKDVTTFMQLLHDAGYVHLVVNHHSDAGSVSLTIVTRDEWPGCHELYRIIQEQLLEHQVCFLENLELECYELKLYEITAIPSSGDGEVRQINHLGIRDSLLDRPHFGNLNPKCTRTYILDEQPPATF